MFRNQEKRNRSKRHDTWAPLSVRLYIIWPTLLAPLTVIGVIEILYQCSQQYHGMAEVSSYGNAATALSRIVPTLVMFTMATMINALDLP